jgi:hypothetical protein
MSIEHWTKIWGQSEFTRTGGILRATVPVLGRELAWSHLSWIVLSFCHGGRPIPPSCDVSFFPHTGWSLTLITCLSFLGTHANLNSSMFALQNVGWKRTPWMWSKRSNRLEQGGSDDGAWVLLWLTRPVLLMLHHTVSRTQDAAVSPLPWEMRRLEHDEERTS